MTLGEWIAENNVKKIEFVNGKLRIVRDEPEYYTYLDSYGLPTAGVRMEEGDSKQYETLKGLGNFFADKWEAKRAGRMLKLRAFLKECGARGYDVDKENWCIYETVDSTYEVYLADYRFPLYDLYFDSESEAEEAVNLAYSAGLFDEGSNNEDE